MPPKLRVKKFTINKAENDILETYFKGEISLINLSSLTKLYDEGLITDRIMTKFKNLRQYYNKSE